MKIGFIGFGHMAGAMAKGLVRSGHIEGGDIYACASDYEKLCERIEKGEKEGEYPRGVHPMKSPVEVAREAGIIIIAVKPKQVEEVILPIREELVGRIVVSVAFGLDFDAYDKMLNGEGAKAKGSSDIKHISIIPNTPCEVCQGITIVEAKHNLTEPELEMIKEFLRKFGEIEFLPSDKMWLAGEVSSCGPAFAAMFIEALGDAGAKYGLDREQAYRIVSRMVSGTGILQAETGKSPGIMVDEVATPGGVTIKGVTALREAGFHDITGKAIEAIEESKK